MARSHDPTVGRTPRSAAGALAGLRRASSADKPRFLVSVHLLNRAVSAEVEREWIDCSAMH